MGDLRTAQGRHGPPRPVPRRGPVRASPGPGRRTCRPDFAIRPADTGSALGAGGPSGTFCGGPAARGQPGKAGMASTPNTSRRWLLPCPRFRSKPRMSPDFKVLSVSFSITHRRRAHLMTVPAAPWSSCGSVTLANIVVFPLLVGFQRARACPP